MTVKILPEFDNGAFVKNEGDTDFEGIPMFKSNLFIYPRIKCILPGRMEDQAVWLDTGSRLAIRNIIVRNGLWRSSFLKESRKFLAELYNGAKQFPKVFSFLKPYPEQKI